MKHYKQLYILIFRLHTALQKYGMCTDETWQRVKYSDIQITCGITQIWHCTDETVQAVKYSDIQITYGITKIWHVHRWNISNSISIFWHSDYIQHYKNMESAQMKHYKQFYILTFILHTALQKYGMCTDETLKTVIYSDIHFTSCITQNMACAQINITNSILSVIQITYSITKICHVHRWNITISNLFCHSDYIRHDKNMAWDRWKTL